jgi:hypothetical protein
MTGRLADVLAVGAGPTGLALAAQLAACGVRARLVDRGLDRVQESRALAIQPRTISPRRTHRARGTTRPARHCAALASPPGTPRSTWYAPTGTSATAPAAPTSPGWDATSADGYPARTPAPARRNNPAAPEHTAYPVHRCRTTDRAPGIQISPFGRDGGGRAGDQFAAQSRGSLRGHAKDPGLLSVTGLPVSLRPPLAQFRGCRPATRAWPTSRHIRGGDPVRGKVVRHPGSRFCGWAGWP